MRFRLALALLGFLAVLVSAPPAAAATFTYPSAACPQGPMGLNNCINAAADGDTIVVKPGTYLENTININHAVTVAGNCKKPPVFDGAAIGGSFDDNDIFVILHDDVTIQCLSLIHANYAVNNSDAGSGTGGFLRLKVLQSNFRTLEHAVGLSGGADFAEIKNNTIVGLDHRAIDVDPNNTNSGADFVRVIGNVHNTSDAGFIDSNAPSTEWLISKNTAMLLDDDFIEWDVDPLTNSTIRDNSARAITGAAIHLGSGSDGNTVTANGFRNLDGSGVDITGHDNVVMRNSVTGFANDDALRVAGDRTIVTGNSVKAGVDGDALDLSGNGPFTVTENKVAGQILNDNYFIDCDGSCAGTLVSKNSSRDNSAAFDGFFIDEVGCAAYPCLTVTQNEGRNLEGRGLVVMANYSDVSRNIVADSGGYSGGSGGASGIWIEGDFNQISLNRAVDNNFNGIELIGQNNTMTSNEARRNGMHGIQVGRDGAGPTSDDTLSFNRAFGNWGDGITVNDSTGANTISVDHTNSSGNRVDCTVFDMNSITAASLLPAAGNACADGSNFMVTQSIFP
jgi:hypothetical protein